VQKTLFFTAVAVLLTFASCQKMVDTVQERKEDILFTATIASPDTKTTVNAANGKVAWEIGDEITVFSLYTMEMTSAKYKVEKITDGVATFKKVEGEPELEGAPYIAVYGSDPSILQSYSNAPPSLPMMSLQSYTTELVFTVSCGLLEITLTKNEESIKRLSVSDGTNTYTLSCEAEEGGAVSISEGATFYIAVPPATYTSFSCVNANGDVCNKQNLNISVAANHIKPVRSSRLYFDKALSGVFTVFTNKRIRFSRGNLFCTKISDMWEWHFYEQQYDVLAQSSASDSDTEIDLFTWGYNATNSVIPTTSLYEETFTDWGDAAAVQATIGTGWFTLSYDEWLNLLGINATRPRTQANRFAKARVHDVPGLLLFPDGYNGTTTVTGVAGISEVNSREASFPTSSIAADKWDEMEADGCVFLPNAGFRAGSHIYTQSKYLYYWLNYYSRQATLECLDGVMDLSVGPDDSCGKSVRLVRLAE